MAVTANSKAYIRQKFVEDTGRFDLVQDTTNYADNGADLFIEAGLKLLEAWLGGDRQTQVFPKDVAAGTALVEMKYLKAVQKVEIMKSDEIIPVYFKPYQEFRKEYNKPLAQLERGQPKWWTYQIGTLSRELTSLTSANYTSQFTYGSEFLRFHDEMPYDYSGILLGPPPDQTYSVHVYGTFYQYLEGETDKNFYSINHPDLWVLAAKLVLYMHYDNSQAVRDQLLNINIYFEKLDNDTIETEVRTAGLQRKGL